MYIYVYPIIHISAHQISTLKSGYNGNKTKQRNTTLKKIKTLNNINDSSVTFKQKILFKLKQNLFQLNSKLKLCRISTISCNRSHLCTCKDTYLDQIHRYTFIYDI